MSKNLTGRIVEYTLSESDAKYINKRRDDSANLELSEVERYVLTGFRVEAGESYPMVIVRSFIYGYQKDEVNGQVMLDGSDTLWLTKVPHGDGQGHWRLYQRS